MAYGEQLRTREVSAQVSGYKPQIKGGSIANTNSLK